MAAKKLKVEFVKRFEDRDKDGNKLVVEAGTKAEMTPDEVEQAGGKVRVIRQDREEDEAGEPDGSEGKAGEPGGSEGRAGEPGGSEGKAGGAGNGSGRK